MTNIQEKRRLDQPLPPEPGAAPNPTEEEIKKLAEEARATHTAYQEELKEEEKEAKEEFDKIIESEDEFLNFFSEDKYKLEVIYNRTLFKLEILPIMKGQDLSYLDMDLAIYTDLQSEEQEVIDKFFKGEELTPAEQDTYNEIEKKATIKATDEVNEKFNKILATHITWPSHDKHQFDERLEFWRRVSFNFRTFIAQKVIDALGIDGRDTLKLFR